MKILTPLQLKQADTLTSQKQHITSWQLMERAAYKLLSWVTQYVSKADPITILAGAGNNGGDGLALARLLRENDYQVQVYLLAFAPLSADCKINKKRLEETQVSLTILNQAPTHPITLSPVVIDAIFGTGLNRPAPQWVQTIIQQVNNSGRFIISVDMPSGLPTDAPPFPNAAFVKPTVVLTFQTPKLPFFLPQTGQYIHDFVILDIGLDAQYLTETNTTYTYLTKDSLPQRRCRPKFSHKGTYGHALLIGGSYGKMGAVILSGTAVLRSGAGLLTVAVPQCGYEILQTALPEAMVLTSHHPHHFTGVTIPFTPSVIAVGVGWGTHLHTAHALFKLFEAYPQVPFVIDADALNILAADPQLLSQLPQEAILTPHPKELQRLIGDWTDDYQKLAKAKAFAAKYGVVLVIKGAHTIITDGSHYWINSTGNSGMATAGSGDVLTGIITGLRAQGYSALEAALLGVYQHGAKAEEAALKKGYNALMARDLY